MVLTLRKTRGLRGFFLLIISLAVSVSERKVSGSVYVCVVERNVHLQKLFPHSFRLFVRMVGFVLAKL